MVRLYPFFLFACLLLCQPSRAKHHGKASHVVKVRSLLMPSARKTCTSSPSKVANYGQSNNHTSRLTVVSRGGGCSAAAAASLSQLLREDEARATSIRRRLRPRESTTMTALSDSIPARPGRSLGTGNYVATISLGEPRRELTVVLDTGSDLTWVQCQPCLVRCQPQEEPLFDPSRSSSFENVSCPSASCSSLLDATGNDPTCESSLCLYSIKYGDNSYSVGILSRDALALSDDGSVIPSFLFGCGQSNEGLFGRAAGILGLGRDPISLVSQSAATFGRRAFSYCLPTAFSTGHLTFGATATDAASYTRILTNPAAPSLYTLDLLAIRVAGRLLPVPSSVFQTGGTIIDSGTVITRLPPAAYAALRTAFRQAMRWYRPAAKYSILDTCFDLGRYSSVTTPAVEMVFSGGTTLNVPAEGLLVGPSTKQLCLAFAANEDADDVGIIGNMQQMTVEVIYDVDNSRIGFAAGGCS